jgi:hypothetical protein
MLPEVTAAAASFLKSGDAAMLLQLRTPAPARVVQVTPLSVETIILPPEEDAISLLKSGEDANPIHCLLPPPAMAAQLTPLSLDM